VFRFLFSRSGLQPVYAPLTHEDARMHNGRPVQPFFRVAEAALAFALLASPSLAATLDAGAGKTYATPSAAIAAASSGDTVRIFPGQYFDCATVMASPLTIEGVGDPAGVALTDKTCQGKALLIAHGADLTVRNLTLTRARVPDGNGAGIRAEGHRLTVDGVRFVNNQNGILTDAEPDMVVTVRNSQFTKNGVCQGFCAHGIYAGKIASLTVQNSIFRETRQGHDIKSRAARTEVTGCDIQDGPTGTASYLVEIPNGGAVIVRNNTLEKGPNSGNHTAAISIGAEGVDQPTPEITVEDNRLANDGDYHTFLVNNMTATEATLRRNKLSGSADPLMGDGSSQ
jgi:hypothetical protein